MFFIFLKNSCIKGLGLLKLNVNVNIKMYKSDKIKMYNYSKLT